MYLFIDFETQSDADLRKIDAVNYVNDDSTKVVCCAWYLRDDLAPFKPEHVQLTWEGFPEIYYENITVVAHNVSFEQAVIQKFFPEVLPKIGKWIDTMALASINNIRRGLAQAAADCGIEQSKHTAGQFVMRRMNSQAGKAKNLDVSGLTDQEKEDLGTYCKQDVVLTVALYRKLISTFTKQEHELWKFTNEENWKGVPLDLELARKGAARVQAWQEQVPKRVAELTDGTLNSVNQVAKLSKFLGLENVTAPVLREKLKTETDPIRIELMNLRLEGGKKSVSKFQAALDKQVNGNILHAMDYHAAATGRFASRGVQLQNLIKADKDTAEQIIQELKDDVEWPAAVTISRASKAIRGLFVPYEGEDLIKSDYSQVEARILAWLVNDSELLNDFATGQKIYEKMAAHIFDVPLEEVTQDQRFFGKSAVLGCGYGMGPAKFQAAYGVEEELAQRSVQAYRQKNHRVVTFWKTLESAIKSVIRDGQSKKLGHLIIWRDSWRLFIKLPSGRNLVYPYPRVEGRDMFHKTRKQGQFVELSYWGGTFVENICQAISRDLLAAALLALKGNDTYTFLFTVHDELIYSAPQLCYDLDDFSKLIIDSVPEWAKGMPLAVDTEVYHRYFK
jgi:DNA polymerase